MPVHCEIPFQRICDDEMRAIDYPVVSFVFATHQKIGCLADEGVYQRELLRVLQGNNLDGQIEVPVELSFRDFSIPLKLDLALEKKVIYELKTVSTLSGKHVSQLLNYLYLTDASHGKLINFRPRTVQMRFVNATVDSVERRRFDFDLSAFCGDLELCLLVKELVKDWGTGLDASLYRRAILHCTRQDVTREEMLPMRSDGTSLGCQRFHLLSSDIALSVTTYKNCTKQNRRDFEKIIALSPVRRLHWLNIVHHKVQLTTIERQ
ncbi:hypothetical protein Rcae01_00122 [Novipirellula caenicola]|uniref:GxxExxY protein n=2 Tax=Novipirellula caenicola TaxID=1536901 RepID=A0ABP9VMP8_9BACT